GAERSAVVASTQDAVPVAGNTIPATGGGPGRVDAGADTVRIDARGLVVAPGFVDLQCNGAAGVDLTGEPERLGEVAAVLPRWGVTSWLPTIVTCAARVRRRALAALAAHTAGVAGGAGGGGAVPLGLHLEGPFLAPRRRGAHDPRHLAAPSLDVFEAEGWSRAAGVALVTLAPELPGALPVVRALVERGVVVAAGHSDATAAQAAAAVAAGVSYVTHL